MGTSFGTDGTEPDKSFPSKHYLSGWCPECGRRRGADARCRNCDPWWTSPLVQAGVPAVLGALFLMTTASALIRQAEKPRGVAARTPGASSLQTVQLNPSRLAPQPRVASVTPVVPRVAPSVDPMAQAVRVQQEGAYINAVLRAQDDARRAQQIAARNREYAAALQQRIQAIAQEQTRSRFFFPAPTIMRDVNPPVNPPAAVSSPPLEEAITGDTVVVPL